MSNQKTIAFYLPQFYPTIENDEWWGKGFTEWTNVAKARPLYPGHYQPRLPADLGFYDLRLPSVREQQVELARQAGIYGFCYWHYWFAGRRLLDTVFSEVVSSGKPDFPFCLCWANHSWHKKSWAPDQPDVLLIEQTYPGKEDYIEHFNALLPAFKDKRYIRVNGKLLFGIFAPFTIPDCKALFDLWNKLAEANGLGGFYFFGLSQGAKHYEWEKDLGLDAIAYDCISDVFDNRIGETKMHQLISRAKRKLFGYPCTVSYENYASYAEKFYNENSSFIPCIDPDFDHSPRSGASWLVVDGSTPERWGRLYSNVCNVVKERNGEVVFIKSWNEWGEGNYLEPDLKWGRRYIEEMSNVIL